MSFYPSIDEVCSLQERYSYIPIRFKLWSDNLTPIRLFQHMKSEYTFLLESVEGGEQWARYSFIGSHPFLLYSVENGNATIKQFQYEGDKVITNETIQSGDPLVILKQLLHQYRTPAELDLPRFSGGAVGYIGYDAIRLYEDIPAHHIDDFKKDDLRFMFCDEIIAFDHLQQDITFIAHLQVHKGMSREEVAERYQAACRRLRLKADTLLKRIEKDTFEAYFSPHPIHDVEWSRIDSNFDQRSFMNAVQRVKAYIRAGDTFQTVLSQRFSTKIETDPFHIYRILRKVNPSPYLYYLDLGDGLQLIGSSPERLVQLDGKNVETNPIAGTRRRGKTAEEDLKFEKELLSDEKEKAEHHMLLDLGRNDVGRIATYGSVNVPKCMKIEKFSHVMHIVSTVEGKVKQGLDAVDCLYSCFPAGTVTGAPKIRAMEIIAELEPQARHAYAGAIGYFSFSGNMDSCITIRTIMVHNGVAYVQAGAGIVADSVPELEWEETKNKARALLVAIRTAEKIFGGKEEELHA